MEGWGMEGWGMGDGGMPLLELIKTIIMHDSHLQYSYHHEYIIAEQYTRSETSLVPRPFPAPVLIACSIKTEGKAWEKESRV